MKKKALTLLEMIMVIFLIGMISGVIAYNLKGSLDKGRAFKTHHAISQIEDILELEAANGHKPATYDKEGIVKVLKDSGMAKNPDQLVQDGWGNEFAFDLDPETGELQITSERYNQYLDRNESLPED